MSTKSNSISKPKFDIVIPSYNDYIVLKECIDSILKFTDDTLCQIFICDDNSQNKKHLEYLQSIENLKKITIIYADENKGFSANVNRGLKLCNNDIFLLNSDIIVKENWSEVIQFFALGANYDITGARLLYEDGTIQHGGGMRNFAAPIWFDHKYRVMENSYFPSVIDNTVLFSTGALLYIKKNTLKKVGLFDEGFLMGFEDVDYCLRSWDNNLRVGYCGGSEVIHKESITRGKKIGEREIISQEYFWQKYDSWFKRKVTTKEGKIKIIFVTQDVGIGGGHRVIFTFANHLSKNNFDVELWNLEGNPSWFNLEKEIKIEKFDNYNSLQKALEPENALKVATWWETAEPVWLGSIKYGLPVYLVQDIESSYYKNDFLEGMRVESKYKPEFNYIVNYKWLERILADEYRLPSSFVGLGVDIKSFYEDKNIIREKNVILVAARSEPLKNFEYSKDILIKLISFGFKVIAYGSDKSLVETIDNVEFHKSPTDVELKNLYNRAEYFIQTSIHEGFSLPPLEAMSCGCIPIVTDAFGNKEYIVIDKLYNSLLIEHNKVDESVNSIINLSRDEDKKLILKYGMNETSKTFNMELCLDRLLNTFNELSKIEYGNKLSNNK
jgi:GT2 family glycosyltransferase/glycosyltransferase involved in cell wall biosynthesis